MSRYYAFCVQRFLFTAIAFMKHKRLCNLVFYEMALFLFQEFLGLLLGIVLAFTLMYPITSTITMLPGEALWNCCLHYSGCNTFRHAMFGTLSLIRSRALRYLWFLNEYFPIALCLQSISNHPI